MPEELVPPPLTQLYKNSRSPPKQGSKEDESITLIRAMEAYKSAMIAEENYPAAKMATTLLVIAHRGADEVARLNKDKQAAIARDDFDQADALKQDVVQIKNAIRIKLANEGFTLNGNNEIQYKPVVLVAHLLFHCRSVDVHDAPSAGADESASSG